MEHLGRYEISVSEVTCENNNGSKAITFFTKKFHQRCLAGS